jgi:hypothetical protein
MNACALSAREENRSATDSSGEDLQRPELASDVGQGYRLELATPPDRFLVERDRLLGRLPGGGQLVQAPLAMEVLHRGNAAGVDVRA